MLKKFLLGLIYACIGATLLAPLFVDNRFFFPFISTKIFIFRIAVAIMVAAYLALNALTNEYRPRQGKLLYSLIAFIAVATVSSILAGNFWHGFWGDMERGEGLILWLFMLGYFVVLTSVVRTEKFWHRLLDFTLGSALLNALFGLGQALHLKALLTPSGSRIDGTFGNPAFFATYLLFHLAFALWLLNIRREPVARVYYALCALLFTWGIFASQTRGAILGLAAGIGVACIVVLWARRKTSLGIWSGRVLACLVVIALGLFFLRNTNFIQQSPILRSITSISFQERTAETRLATWQVALQGWREQPILGWGLENFERVFNAHFPEVVYEDEGSQVWFDRAHNFILDRAVTTGTLGLAAFLFFVFYPFWVMLRKTKQDGPQFSFVVGLGLITAYAVQNFFVFESVTGYIVLFFAWSFFSFAICQETMQIPLKGFAATLAGVAGVVLLVPTLWYTAIQAASVNMAAAYALQYDSEKDNFFSMADKFKPIFDSNTYGTSEYRLNYIEWIDQQLAPVGQIVPQVEPVLAYADTQVEQLLTSDLRNVKYLLLSMRHYNYTNQSLAGSREERLKKALSLYPRAHELSPGRPHIQQEAGYSYLYLYRTVKDTDKTLAQEYHDQSEKLFKEAIELNPKVVDSYISLIMLYFNAGEDDKVAQVVADMDTRGVSYRREQYIAKLLGLAEANKRLRWIGHFAQEATTLNPNDGNAWIKLAVYYATTGDRSKAIETAEHIKQLDVGYDAEADQFIENVKKGTYEKNQTTPP